ncbi:YoaK family protein [Flavobacterium sp.]|uniref:YoaK family protein n=1 Tax=Flavobacterium sp. TaxID=239 RepID=UPI002622611D|nr:YoaK family protein [Flavobacterium sp.]MDD2986066.1 YoaK family protein [Flavobacterium sp.]
MFRHQGKSRTLQHNLRIATILSFVAGIVNVTGFLSFKQLTTNVTGHFALFINDVANFEFWKGTIYFLYIFSYFFGSFSSSFLIEKYRENKKLNVFVLPTIIECLILITIGLFSNFIVIKSPDLIICLLLFAMGLQNSFVTKISNAVVRTTHLTGLFTDLGIDVSHLMFPKLHPHRDILKANIKLRIFIIAFFFIGGIVGGFLYSTLDWKLNTLIFGALILLLSLFFDDFRYQLLKKRRKNKMNKIAKSLTNEKANYINRK